MMYVKTTKGVYEVATPCRQVKRIDSKGKIIDLGEVVEQSENADDLIDVVIRIDKDKCKCSFVAKLTSLELRNMKDAINFFKRRIIALSWIGDDLLKTFEWDNDKGEWKLYERN